MSIDIARLSNSFAYEVHGVRLWESLEDETKQTLRAAFSEHPLLLFRRQALSEEELVAVATIFGLPAVYVERSWHSSRPEVSIVSNMHNGVGERIGGLSSRELNWHTDQSYNAHPVTGCFLYAQVVPNGGGTTSWASLYGAYESLPDWLKRKIDTAVGTFSYAARTHTVIPGGDGKTLNQSYQQRIADTPDVKHPIVQVHPGTGRKSIYIDPGTLIGIDGLAKDDADGIIKTLEQHATANSNIYVHRWQIGDLMLWDNAVTLHRREAFADDECRLMKRMLINLPQERHIQPPVLS